MTGPLARLAAALLLGTAAAAAQDPVRVIDFGPPAADTAPPRPGIPDSILVRAVATFNAPGTARLFGDAVLRADVAGTVGVHRGTVRVGGTIRGDVVVLNGDLFLEATGRITGQVTVLGGRFLLDTGARHDGGMTAYRERAPVELLPRGELVIRPPRRTLADVTSALSLRVGDAVLAPQVAVGAYNRVEGFPIRVGANATWSADERLRLRAEGDVTLRTARDPAGTRGPTGWSARLAADLGGGTPLTLGFEASEAIGPTAEQPFVPDELSLSALVARRDWRDWIGVRTVGAFATWRPRPSLAVRGRVASQRERSVAAVDAFSILRADEPWRPNPLVDDGRYRVIELGAEWDTRDAADGMLGSLVRTTVRRTGSAELSPILLPEQVRDPMPVTDYAAWELAFDLRHALRLHPEYALHVRAAGAGWIGGDPLTVQRRLAMGGVDPLAGYGFRAVTCDPRRRPDPAGPALCDRQLVVQAEVRRSIPLRLGTRLGAYALGIEQADLMVFGDAGTAWLAGDGPGQVPSGRIQALSEWKGSVGIGVDAGLVGVYLAKAVADDLGPRLSFRLSRRF